MATISMEFILNNPESLRANWKYGHLTFINYLFYTKLWIDATKKKWFKHNKVTLKASMSRTFQQIEGRGFE